MFRKLFVVTKRQFAKCTLFAAVIFGITVALLACSKDEKDEIDGFTGQSYVEQTATTQEQSVTGQQTTTQEQSVTEQQATTQEQSITEQQTTTGDSATQKTTTTQKVTNEEKTTTTAAVTIIEKTTAQEETTVAKPDTETTAQQRAEKLLAKMTLEEKVGQMFIARCPESNAKELADQYHLGGYILFARDFKNKTKAQVISTISGYQQASEIPMLIGVDEEGGKVNRVSLYTEFRQEPFKSPQELYSLGGMAQIRADALEKSRLLKSLGINLNFAPVADVSQNSEDFIHGRTFGKDAVETSEYVKNVVSVMKQESMGSVLKHFPGYGNNEDTHTGIAYDNRSYQSFVTSDFLPFEAGIEAGADIVMVAHNIVYCMDSEYPASLSSKVHEVLRNELGFTGVIITDELSMEGVQQFATDDEIAVLAVQAGNDLLCCTNFQEQIEAVITAVKNGTISEERINESVLRILKLKISLGML